MDSVLGRAGGCSAGGGGDAISSEGLEQLPTAALDSEPLFDGGGRAEGLVGVEGGEGDGVGEASGVASVPQAIPQPAHCTFSLKMSRIRWGSEVGLARGPSAIVTCYILASAVIPGRKLVIALFAVTGMLVSG